MVPAGGRAINRRVPAHSSGFATAPQARLGRADASLHLVAGGELPTRMPIRTVTCRSRSRQTGLHSLQKPVRPDHGIAGNPHTRDTLTIEGSDSLPFGGETYEPGSRQHRRMA